MKPFLRFGVFCMALIFLLHSVPFAMLCSADTSAVLEEGPYLMAPETTEHSNTETIPEEGTKDEPNSPRDKVVCDNELSFFADTVEQAREIADAMGAKLVSYQYGIGTLRQESDIPVRRQAAVDGVVFYPEYQYTVEYTEEEIIVDEEPEDNSLEQWHLAALHAQQAWEMATGKNVLVAVIDTGVDMTHEDLIDAITAAETAVPADYYGELAMFPADYQGSMDYLGHGTHVAGIVCARNNGFGCTGIAPECSVLSIKALERSGNQGKGKSSWVAAAIHMAVERGADVINLSAGGTIIQDALLIESVQMALDAGVFVVCAAGNVQTPVVMYPGAYEGVIAVSAVKPQGASVTFASNYSNSGDWISYAAPGSNIVSTIPGGYDQKTGTSMACAMFSGALALMLSMDPCLTADQIQQLMRSTAQDLGDPGKDAYYGYGMPNLTAMLERYHKRIVPDTPSADIPSGNTLLVGTPISMMTQTIYGKIVYTTDGTEPTADSAVWPETPLCFSEEIKEVSITARTVGKDQTLGPCVSYTYFFVPELTPLTQSAGVIDGVIPIYGDGLDPVLNRHCRRYQLHLPPGQEFSVAAPTEDDNFTLVMFDGNGDDAKVLKPVRKQGNLLWKNKTDEEKMYYLSVVLAENLQPAEEVAYSISFLIQKITSEETNPAKPKPDHPPTSVTEPTIPPKETVTEATEPIEQDVPETVIPVFEEDWIYTMEEETTAEETTVCIPERGTDMPMENVDYELLLGGGVVMLFGIGLLLLGYFAGRKPWLILRAGEPADATVLRIIPCLDRQAYQYQLAYRTRDGQQITAFWNIYKRRPYTRLHPEGSSMKVKYLPESPKKFIVANDHTAILGSACCVVAGVGVIIVAIWIIILVFAS